MVSPLKEYIQRNRKQSLSFLKWPVLHKPVHDFCRFSTMQFLANRSKISSTDTDAELPFYKSGWSIKWWPGAGRSQLMKSKRFAMMGMISQCNHMVSYGFFELRYTFFYSAFSFFACVHVRFGPVAHLCKYV